VDQLVSSLPATAVVVSGGARGPDTWAAEAAAVRGLGLAVHLPDLAGVRGRGEVARRHHERNQRIVDDAHVVYALVSSDRKGGTEDTIRRAVKAGKPVHLL
jgi:hypothetical protein